MMKTTRRVKPKAKITVKPRTARPAKKAKTGRTKIQSKEVYELTMKEIDTLMKKGEDNLSQKELERLTILSEAAEHYEDTHEPLPVPSSLPDMIRMKMFQLRLKQHFTAKLLGV